MLKTENVMENTKIYVIYPLTIAFFFFLFFNLQLFSFSFKKSWRKEISTLSIIVIKSLLLLWFYLSEKKIFVDIGFKF